MRTSSSLALFFAFVLVFQSMQANAKRLTLEEKQRLKSHHDRKLTTTDQAQIKRTAVATSVANGAQDTNDKDVVTDQNQGKSGATEKNTGADNNEEGDANPTLGQYGAGSSSDSSPDTHRYYCDTNGDDSKPRH